jgi:hypothetical protein
VHRRPHLGRSPKQTGDSGESLACSLRASLQPRARESVSRQRPPHACATRRRGGRGQGSAGDCRHRGRSRACASRLSWRPPEFRGQGVGRDSRPGPRRVRAWGRRWEGAGTLLVATNLKSKACSHTQPQFLLLSKNVGRRPCYLVSHRALN